MSGDEATELDLLAHPPSLRMDGRVVWLTGASRGLGRALAFALAGAGAELLISARSEAPLEKVSQAIRAAGVVAETLVGSIAVPDIVAEGVASIERRWGKLGVLINNAAIRPAFARAEPLAPSDWQEVLDVNLTAPLALATAALPLLKAAGHSSVVNVSSIHGTRGHERLIAYAASKGGMEMVTPTLAIEWAVHNIRVNSVAPGHLVTEMTAGLRAHPRWSESPVTRIPMRRFAQTEEVVPAILLLASPGGSYNYWHDAVCRWWVDSCMIEVSCSTNSWGDVADAQSSHAVDRRTSRWGGCVDFSFKPLGEATGRAESNGRGDQS
jgi:NAD(P)-dependent dehydrogenase (short-subunit alcohol dehydrogenase family)